MARRDYGLWNRTFDIAIIDEAGKAFGAELVIPASVARKVILVGDHNQLPPTVTADVLEEGYWIQVTFEGGRGTPSTQHVSRDIRPATRFQQRHADNTVPYAQRYR